MPPSKRKSASRLAAVRAWRELVAETDYAQFRGRYDAAIAAVKAIHVPELMTRVRRRPGSRGQPADIRLRAFVVLRDLFKSKDVRVEGHQDEMIKLSDLVASREYPQTLLGKSCFDFLSERAPDRARAIAVSIDVASLTDEQREVVANHILGRSEAEVTQLERIVALGDKGARAAQRHLDAIGRPDMKRIRSLAAKWRKSRDKQALHELYASYFMYGVGRMKITEIIKMMGRPSRRRGHSIWYAPDEWTALYLEGNSRGILERLDLAG